MVACAARFAAGAAFGPSAAYPAEIGRRSLLGRMKRIGLLYPMPDPVSPANWSGTPKGLQDGFAANGVEVVGIPCILPEWIRLPVAMLARSRLSRGATAHREPVYAFARSMAIANAIRRAGQLDGIVAMATDFYDLPRATKGCSVPIATYDDGTLALFSRYKDSDLRHAAFPMNRVRCWMRRQQSACRRADVAFVATEWVKQSVVEDYGISERKVAVVGMGHRPRPALRATRSFARPRFLFVGVDWHRKNGAGVVKAFARVRERIPDATLDVVGNHPPLNDPGITGHGLLRLDSERAQNLLDQLFRSATAFVLPSLFEPFGIAYLEAASSGLPIIATSSGGAGTLLGEAAIRVQPQDHDALVAAMLQVADPDVAQRMGACALLKSEGATWNAVTARMGHILFRERSPDTPERQPLAEPVAYNMSRGRGFTQHCVGS
jgi:glycosyltransferase involved in cell wall biosynthesis